jgi:trehalose 6-phosphate phosphatase
VLDDLRERAGDAGIFLDFDGSLSPIVAHPELAGPVDGAREALAALVERYRLVAIVSGRPAEELVHRLDVAGLTYAGLYGIEEAADDLTVSLLPAVQRAAEGVDGARVEDKRVSIAVHYRQSRDPAAARRALVTALEPLAVDSGLKLAEGKKVLELVPVDVPLKGGAVERLARANGVAAALYAGDDVADLEAFAALDRLGASGVPTVKVAVLGDETPAELIASADIAVDGPSGLVEVLRRLA